MNNPDFESTPAAAPKIDGMAIFATPRLALHRVALRTLHLRCASLSEASRAPGVSSFSRKIPGGVGVEKQVSYGVAATNRSGTRTGFVAGAAFFVVGSRPVGWCVIDPSPLASRCLHSNR